MNYLVDTSVIIEYLRGYEAARQLLDSLNGEVTSSYVCLAELYEGVHRVKNKPHAAAAVKQFFSGLTRVYGLDEQTAQRFGRLRAQLKKKGNIIEDLDLLIAATCLAHDAVLVTRNFKHFSRIPALGLYSAGEEQ